MKPFHLPASGPRVGAVQLGVAVGLGAAIALWVRSPSTEDLAWFGATAAAMPAAGVVVGAMAAPAPGEAARWKGQLARLAAAWVGLAVALRLSAVGLAWAQLPSPWPATAVLVGLFLAGRAVAPGGRRSRAAAASAGVRWGALVLLLGWGADGAAAGWGLLQPTPPWSPGCAAWLLDLSPRTLLMECGGVDWMRHPIVYEPAGTDRIGPGLRTVYDGQVAGSATLLVGCLAMATRLFVQGRRPRP